jgi:hypothetical protein
MADECARGERLGWHDFVRDYAAIARTLLRHYFPSLESDIDTHLAAIFQRGRANDNEWFRTLRFTNEREFLMAFRELVFAYGRAAARLPQPEITLEQMTALMQGLTLIERELLWMYVKGYDAAHIAEIMMNAAMTAQAMQRIADERLSQVLPGACSGAFTTSAHALLEAAGNSRADACLPVKTFNNLVNGQISWRERELAEQHIRDCFYCLDRFGAFQEMIRIRRDTRPLSPEEADAILARLDLPAAQSKGILGRLFSRAS